MMTLKLHLLFLFACIGLTGCSANGGPGGVQEAANQDAGAKAQLTSCISNLKNIQTAEEMYSIDNAGSYTKKLEGLTPSYLKTLPTCPAALKVTYEIELAPNSYSIFCKGTNHASVSIPANYPCLYQKDKKAAGPAEILDAPGRPHSNT